MMSTEFLMSILSGVISGLISFFAILVWARWRKPDIKFSQKIAKRNNDGKTSYTLKFINSSKFPVVNVSYKISISETIAYDEGGQGKVTTLKKGRFDYILPHLGKRIAISDEDIENILRENKHITIFVCYTGSLFNVVCRKCYKYKLPDVANGIHESGMSLEVKYSPRDNA